MGQGADLRMAQLMPLPLVAPVNPDWFYLPGFTFLKRLCGGRLLYCRRVQPQTAAQ